MQYFVFGRDRPGTFPLKIRLAEEHWSFMDTYADRLIARGPTLTGPDEDAQPTGSLHIVDLPDARAAHAFAHDEPYHRAGVFASVLVCRFVNLSARTMWDFPDAVDGYQRFLVLAGADRASELVASKHTIVYGDLLGLENEEPLGRAALTEAPAREAAADTGRMEVLPWRFGGRPGSR